LTTQSDHAATERRIRERSSPSFHLVSGGSSPTNAMEKAVWVPYLHTAFPKGTERRKVDSQIQQSTNCVIVLTTTSPYSLRLLSRVILTKTCWPASCCLPQPCTTILLVRRRSLKCSRIN